MRALSAAIGLLALAPLAPALGGVMVTGAGQGDYLSGDGATACPAVPFTAQVLYLPDGRGMMDDVFLGTGACLGLVGTTAILAGVAVNTTQAMPVQVRFFCVGTEAAGMHCEAMQGGTLLVADVGPYAGPGSLVALSTRGAFRFDGAFVAV